MSANATTPFPLGVYVGNPNGSDPSAETSFQANYDSFTATMGAAPQFITTYVDYTKAISDWIGNASWQAWSNAQSPDAAGLTPVIGLPMASIAAGSASPDQQYQQFAAGDYDTVLQGIVQAWAQQGFKNLVFRPGWEMNLQGPTYAGDTAQSQADWVSAFQHIYTVLHQAAATDGVNVQVVWNPGTTNYSNAEATTNLYPGDAYVDAIGADVYSDIYPYSDGGNTPTYHDWDTGGEDTSVAQFIADPVNREHYWTYPAATKWSNDGSGGHSLSLDNLIQFAEAHGKSFAVPETGAGNSDGGTDVSDDAAFPQWLAAQLSAAQASGEKIDFVNIWDSNGGGNYEFSHASDGKPLEAASWAANFGAINASALACFCTGTRILTDRGEVAVEDLVVGDCVVTLSGALEPIRWIGWRRVNLRAHPERALVQPVRIRAGAFGRNAPHRDLLVSPEHAIFADGVLIPARHLVGCTGIATDTKLDATTYYHIELSHHDVLLADGLPCESWLDTGNRAMFENSDVVSLRYEQAPDAKTAWSTKACAPLVTDGPILTALCQRLGAASIQDVTIEGVGTHRIEVAPGAGGVRLLSAAGHASGDARRLGVAVSAIRLGDEPLDLRDPRLGAGFHAAEGGWRWTDGAARIATGISEAPRTLVVEVAAEIQAIACAA